MSLILFNEIVFGPIISRRLGVSLGINLLPIDGKVCSFDCVYCECGFNEDGKTKTRLPDRNLVKAALEHRLSEMKNAGEKLNVITFAGNGEPTIHPQFQEIIDDTIELRNEYFPEVKISVLTNASNISKEKIFNTLKKVDNNILKLDSAFIDTVRLMDKPTSPPYSIEKQVELFKRFDGNFILQTMFLQGEVDGQIVDNTTEKEIEAWLNIVRETKPREVMIYTLDRETPCKTLKKASNEKLDEIGSRVGKLGIKANVTK